MILTFNDFLLEGRFHDFVKAVKNGNFTAASFEYEIVRDSYKHNHSYKKIKEYIDKNMSDDDRKKLYNHVDDVV